MGSSQLKILLVEDTPSEAEHLKRLLDGQTEHRSDVVHVDCLAAGLTALGADDFDVLLLDLHLPDTVGMSGVRSVVERFPELPIIVLTNHDSAQTGSAALREGAQDYLITRDVDARTLSRAMRYAVERQRAETALRISEERYALAVDGAMDGIWDLDIASERLYCSARGRSILGWHEDGRGHDLRALLSAVSEEHREPFSASLHAHLAGATSSFEIECRLDVRDDEDRWVLVRGIAVRAEDERPLRIAGSISDITRRKLAEEKLLHDAMHDALTGLPNRALLMDRLRTSLKRYRRDDQELFAILYFDLDRFKYINDSLGHLVGDRLLIAVAERLARFLRPGDTVARLGGDEFAVLLNELNSEHEATQVAERVYELVGEAIQIDGHTVYTSASIGIALAMPSYAKPEEILRDADLAMYRAKASGGGVRYMLFDKDMHERVIRQLNLETDLRRAVEQAEFAVFYQPIVSMRDGRVSGFEALLRWHHPTRGLVMPGEFITTIEETGLIVPVGWFVLEQACRDLSRWQRKFPADAPLTVSVNTSGRFFLIEDMPQKLGEILERADLDPQCLRLEVTENVMLDHDRFALARLHSLREMGIELHVDDFGTGYSSLSYLQRYQYDSLKIDRSFVQTMSDKVDSSAIVEAIVSLGATLGMSVIAEGVEKPEQVTRLRVLNCPEAQGFWFAPPMPASEVESYLERGSHQSLPWVVAGDRSVTGSAS